MVRREHEAPPRRRPRASGVIPDTGEKMGSTDDAPFGLARSLLGQSFVVLDKSFLDAASSAQLQYYANNGITFVVPEVLMYELMRKRNDDQRRRSLFKLRDVDGGLVRIPGVGELFRTESSSLKPAPSVLKARPVKITPVAGSNDPFPMTPSELRATERRTAALKNRWVPLIVGVWRDLRLMPVLSGALPMELPEKFDRLEREIRDDRDAMRQFYENHREPPYPDARLIDERWTFFRWIQVYLLAGVDFFRRHGVHSQPNLEKLENELLDLEYTISALIVGGLASCEKRVKQRFRFLRPDGFILRGPF